MENELFLGTAINGDCLDEMGYIPDKSIDMILCDLPYGTTACIWDSVIPFAPLWKEYERIIKDNGAIVLTAAQPFTSTLIGSNLSLFKYCWIWEKDNASNFFAAKFMPLNDTEDICVFSKGGVNNGTKNPARYYPQGTKAVNINLKNGKTVGGLVGAAHGTRTSMAEGKEYTQTTEGYPFKTLKFKRDSDKFHPTQKPVALFEYLIKTYTNPGELVLDNCAGSFTTAIACINTGRRYICIEKDEAYYNLGVNRIKEHSDFLL